MNRLIRHEIRRRNRVSAVPYAVNRKHDTVSEFLRPEYAEKLYFQAFVNTVPETVKVAR